MNRLIRDCRGVAAIEFVLVAGVMIMALGAVLGFATVAMQQIALEGALKAGGDYLRSYPTTATTTQLQTLMRNSLPAGAPTLTVSQIQCFCNGSGTASTCPGSDGTP